MDPKVGHQLKEEIREDTVRLRPPSRELVLRIYDRFILRDPTLPGQIPVNLVLGPRTEMLIGMFDRDVRLCEVLEVALFKRGNL